MAKVAVSQNKAIQKFRKILLNESKQKIRIQRYSESLLTEEKM